MASRYWVGGTGSWNGTAGSKWALTSGGTGGQAEPTSSDDVFFDASSGAVTVTVATTAATCNNLNFTGFTGSFSGATALTCSASLTYASTMAGNAYSGTMTFNATSGSNTVTTGGRSLAHGVNFNGAGGTWTFQDNFTTTGNITVTAGTVTATTQDVQCFSFNANTAGVRALNLGSGTWTMTATNSTIWAFGTSNMTFDAGTSTIKFTGGSASAKSIQGAGATYYRMWISGSGSGSYSFTGSSTFFELKDDNSVAHSLLFTAGTTQTVDKFTVSGSSGNVITISSASGSTSTHALVKRAGGAVSCDWLNIQHSVATPSTLIWYAGANSTDNNSVATGGSGWIFTVPPAKAAGTMLLMGVGT